MRSVPPAIASPGTTFGFSSTWSGTPAARAASARRSSSAGATTRANSTPSLRNDSNTTAPKYLDPTSVIFIEPRDYWSGRHDLARAWEDIKLRQDAGKTRVGIRAEREPS